MRNINLNRLTSHLFAALMLFLAGFSSLLLLDLPLAAAGFFATGLLFAVFAFERSSKEPE